MTTLLIIEDEAPLLDELLHMLRFEGYDVFGALNGVVGVQLAREHHPDLIISDIIMPLLDGYGVLLALQDDPETCRIPFIFLTGKTERLHYRQGMELGADDYITKPFKRDDLLSAIHTRIDLLRTVQEGYTQQVEELRQSLSLALPHELRTPLTGLVGYSELLITDHKALQPDQIRSMAEMLRLAGLRLKRQVENFLLYAYLDMIRLDPELMTMLRTQQVAAPASLITFTAQQVAAWMERSDDLTVQAGDALVQISADNLQKIVTEIIDNALKFSSPGTPVRITAHTHDDHYLLTCSDQGRGMTAQQIKRTGAYVQFERRLHEQQGAGLGLALAAQLITLHEGELIITSTKDQGTQLTITLPLAHETND